MVWKAAAQTRFRMFKHGNGIAVGVIACFQLLQNFQVIRKRIAYLLRNSALHSATLTFAFVYLL
jgi:hypothetical protein